MHESASRRSFLKSAGLGAAGTGRRWALFAGCLASWVLALGSKEIAATLPIVLWLYEWYFVQELRRDWLKRSIPFLLAAFFLSRTMPQMNILSVGFSVRAFVAIAVAALALSVSQELLLDAIWDGLELTRLAFGLDPDHLHLVN